MKKATPPRDPEKNGRIKRSIVAARRSSLDVGDGRKIGNYRRLHCVRKKGDNGDKRLSPTTYSKCLLPLATKERLCSASLLEETCRTGSEEEEENGQTIPRCSAKPTSPHWNNYTTTKHKEGGSVIATNIYLYLYIKGGLLLLLLCACKKGEEIVLLPAVVWSLLQGGEAKKPHQEREKKRSKVDFLILYRGRMKQWRNLDRFPLLLVLLVNPERSRRRRRRQHEPFAEAKYIQFV